MLMRCCACYVDVRFSMPPCSCYVIDVYVALLYSLLQYIIPRTPLVAPIAHVILTMRFEYFYSLIQIKRFTK